MKLEFEQIVTKNGDGGKSSTWDGEVRWKDDFVFEVLGDIDELNSWLGAISSGYGPATIQDTLHDVMALIATDPNMNSLGEISSEKYEKLKKINNTHVEGLEIKIQEMMKRTPVQNSFINPKGFGHVARTVCRRAERHLVKYMNEKQRFDLKYCSMYLNRLSDYLFIWSINHQDD